MDTKSKLHLAFLSTFLWGAISVVTPINSISHAQELDTSAPKFYGEMKAGPRQFRFLIELSLENGNGKLISLDEGKREFPLQSVTLSEKSLSFELKVSGAAYDGTLSDSGVYEGWWKQRGGSFALNFRRVEKMPTFEYQAIWEGQINLVVQKLDLRFRELKSGEVYMDSVSQLAGGFVTQKATEGDQVSFKIPSLGAEFKGTLNDAGDSITGKWKQGFVPAVNLVLKKVDAKESLESEAPKRPQTPQPPFPYLTEDVLFENEEAGIELAGTLTIPKGSAKTACVVLISGSGPQDRDESLMNHKPFWVIADHLSRNGIAVLRYDDRGVGKSAGDFSRATTLDFVSDVEAAVAFLRNHDRIDPARIGLCGHSEGGIIAPLVAREDPAIKFIVMLAGPGVNGRQISVDQADAILRVSGVGPEDRQRQRQIQEVLFRLAESDPPLSKDDFRKQALSEIAPLLSEKEKSQNIGQETVEVAVAQVLTPWFNFFLSHEPAPVLETLNCSVLAINGAKDLQVTPGLNIPAIKAALEKAPTSDFEVVEMTGLNHLFQQCQTGLVSEYGEIEETINPKVLAKLSTWINERTKR